MGGGGGGGSSGETKIAEGIRDAKNCRFVLYIAFPGKKVGGGGSTTHGDGLQGKSYLEELDCLGTAF